MAKIDRVLATRLVQLLKQNGILCDQNTFNVMVGLSISGMLQAGHTKETLIRYFMEYVESMDEAFKSGSTEHKYVH